MRARRRRRTESAQQTPSACERLVAVQQTDMVALPTEPEGRSLDTISTLLKTVLKEFRFGEVWNEKEGGEKGIWIAGLRAD